MSIEDVGLLASMLMVCAFLFAFAGYCAARIVIEIGAYISLCVRKRGAAAPWRPRVEAALRRHEFAVRVLRARLERSR